MLDTPQTYPLLRGRRRHRTARRRPRWLSARKLRLAGIALVGVALVAGIVLLARRASAPDPRQELVRALAAFQRGNYSAARNHAQIATTGPDAAMANAILGRAYLALGEGLPAEGALNRAVAAGLDPARVHQLFAEAWLLQGDSDRALVEAAKAPARYAAYARRIRARALAAEGDVPAATQTLQGVIARNPRDAGAWTDLGRIRLEAGDISGADEAARRGIALDPSHIEALVLRGAVVRSRYGLAAALPWFEQALKQDAFFHPALIESAATLGDLGRYAVMLGATRRALAARPGSPQALYLQAVLAARAARFDLASAMIAKMGDAGASTPGVLLLSGGLDYTAGRYEQAVATWRELVGRQPMNITARRLLGAALLRSGDARGALDVLRPVALRPDADSYTLALVGRAFEATGERDWAATYLDRAQRPTLAGPSAFGADAGVAVLANAVADAPGDPGVAVAYVRGLLDDGDAAGALARAQAIAAASPGAPGAQLLVGDVLATTGHFGPALGAYARAADLRFDAPTLLRLAEAADRAGRRKSTADALALYLSQNPESVVARRALVNLQLGARDWGAAIDTLEALRAGLGDRDALLLAQLAHAYAGVGDAKAAVSYARPAYDLAPMNAAVCDAYGWALYESGNTRGALQLLRKAAVIAPDDAGIRWHFAQALADAGAKLAARKQIDRALADPAFMDRAAAAALLRAL